MIVFFKLKLQPPVSRKVIGFSSNVHSPYYLAILKHQYVLFKVKVSLFKTVHFLAFCLKHFCYQFFNLVLVQKLEVFLLLLLFWP